MTSRYGRPNAVLVVDDDDHIRGVVVMALRRAGFEVLEAASGQAGLDIVQTAAVGLVILDMGMPGMSGTEVVQALRARPETATMPVLLMTGSGDEFSVIHGLSAGADDFVPKPVRLDELVARVNAHLRQQSAWSNAVEAELRTRTAVVAALGRIRITAAAEEAADAVVRELARDIDADFISVLQVDPGVRLKELATYTRSTGIDPGGHALSADVSREVLARARAGPWAERLDPGDTRIRTEAFSSANLELVVGAPIYGGELLVGLLTIGMSRGVERPTQLQGARLLAAAIDYAGVLSAMAGSSFADHQAVEATRDRLREVLDATAFHPVFQPIVDLETLVVVGFEALTRFHDGTRADVRFAEAARVELGDAFEFATVVAAMEGATSLPSDAFLSLNVSPGYLLRADPRFRQLVVEFERPLVLELTEHVPIDDYGIVRAALQALGNVRVAVDDAGAGYASMRHILELQPAFAKLDISLVRGIDRDQLRQALAAGLEYFGFKSGCRLIAEGVETEEEAAMLRVLGVELAQGFLFGRPEQVG